MIIKNTSQIGDPIIRTKAKKVRDPKSTHVKRTIKNLIDSMRHHGLVGMAAPQIGQNHRVFVTELRETKVRKGKEHLDPLRVFINPHIISTSKKTSHGWEGCGSVAHAYLFGKVRRPVSVVIEALDEEGVKFKVEAKGLLARVIQHEVDHLNGIFFSDTADPKSYVSRDEFVKREKK